MGNSHLLHYALEKSFLSLTNVYLILIFQANISENFDDLIISVKPSVIFCSGSSIQRQIKNNNNTETNCVQHWQTETI